MAEILLLGSLVTILGAYISGVADGRGEEGKNKQKAIDEQKQTYDTAVSTQIYDHKLEIKDIMHAHELERKELLHELEKRDMIIAHSEKDKRMYQAVILCGSAYILYHLWRERKRRETRNAGNDNN